MAVATAFRADCHTVSCRGYSASVWTPAAAVGQSGKERLSLGEGVE